MISHPRRLPIRLLRVLLGLSISGLLAACGGGGGSDPPDGDRECCFVYESSWFVPAVQQPGPDPSLGRQWHLLNLGQTGGTPGEDLNLPWVTSASWAPGKISGRTARVAALPQTMMHLQKKSECCVITVRKRNIITLCGDTITDSTEFRGQCWE